MQAKINIKGNANNFAERLDSKFQFQQDVRLHWTGCPNTCSQIQVGDIGLIGTTAKNAAGKPCEAVDIYVGGGIGQDAALGSLHKKAVPVEEGLMEELEAICIEKFGAVPKAVKSQVCLEICSVFAPLCSCDAQRDKSPAFCMLTDSRHGLFLCAHTCRAGCELVCGR